MTNTTKTARKKHGAAGRKRQNGCGTLERHNGKWRARFLIDIDGRKVVKTQTLKADTLDEARKELADLSEGNAMQTREKAIERDLKRLEGVRAEIRDYEESKPSLAVAEAWATFDDDEESRARDKATQRNYGQWFAAFSRWLADAHPEITELRGVSPQIAVEYSRHLKTLVRGTTFNRHFNALALIWATLSRKDADGKPVHRDARLGTNPFAYDKHTKTGIARVKLTKDERPHRRRDLTLDEVAAIFKTAEGEMRVLLALGFYTGYRLGDCATLQWSNIDRINMIITIRSRKTDILTETRINPALASVIEADCDTSKCRGYLLPEMAKLYNGGTTGQTKLVRMIADIFERAGIETSFKAEGDKRARPDCGFHSLRHTYITQLERLGATLEERRKLAGHSTTQMTKHYTHEDASRPLMLPDLTAQTEAAADAATDAPAESDTVGGYATPSDASDRLATFISLYERMTPDERERARQWVNSQA